MLQDARGQEEKGAGAAAQSEGMREVDMTAGKVYPLGSCNLGWQRGRQPLRMLNSKRGCCALVGERISVGFKATER